MRDIGLNHWAGYHKRDVGLNEGYWSEPLGWLPQEGYWSEPRGILVRTTGFLPHQDVIASASLFCLTLGFALGL